MSVMEILVKAVDQATDVIEKVGSQGVNVAQKLNAEWGKIALASGALAVGLEATSRKQAEMTRGTALLADALGVTNKEIRDSVNEITNVSFPLEDAIGLMTLGRQQGLESLDVLKKYANFWDMVADATDGSSTALADAGVALHSVGIAAGEEDKSLAALGFIFRDTTMGVEEFLRMMSRMGPDLRAMGLGVNETAAILGALERELGLSGMAARMEFTPAVNQSGGSLKEMLKILGLSQEQYETYLQKVIESGDVIERSAVIDNQKYTALQKISMAVQQATYDYGGLFSLLNVMTPVLLALPIAIKAIANAKQIWAVITKGVTLAQAALNAVMSANPIAIVILAIAALVAAGILLWKNWDKVVKFFQTAWDYIKIAFATGVKFIANTVLAPFLEFWGKIIGGIATGVGKLVGLFNKDLGRSIEETAQKIMNAREVISDWADNLIDSTKAQMEARKVSEATAAMVAEQEAQAQQLSATIKIEADKQVSARLSAIADEREAAQKAHDDSVDAIKKEYGEWEGEAGKTHKTRMDLAREATEETKKQLDEEIEAAKVAANKKIAELDREYRAKIKVLDAETAYLTQDLQNQIDAIDAQTEAENRAMEEAEDKHKLAELTKAVETAESTEDRLTAEKALSDFSAELVRKDVLYQREQEKQAIRDRMQAIREEAQVKKDALTEEFEKQKQQENDLLTAKIERLEGERDALDEALKAELQRLADERNAKIRAEDDELVKKQNTLDAEVAAVTNYHNELLDEERRFALALAEIQSGMQSSADVIVGSGLSVAQAQTAALIPAYSYQNGQWYYNPNNTVGAKNYMEYPEIPLKDKGGMVEGPGLFRVGAGVKEIVRSPSSMDDITSIIANAIERGLASVGIKVEVGGEQVEAIVSAQQFNTFSIRSRARGRVIG